MSTLNSTTEEIVEEIEWNFILYGECTLKDLETYLKVSKNELRTFLSNAGIRGKSQEMGKVTPINRRIAVTRDELIEVLISFQNSRTKSILRHLLKERESLTWKNASLENKIDDLEEQLDQNKNNQSARAWAIEFGMKTDEASLIQFGRKLGRICRDELKQTPRKIPDQRNKAVNIYPRKAVDIFLRQKNFLGNKKV